MEERLDGQYTGVGIEITADKNNNKIIINKVFSNSSAMDAGLKAGDELIALDGVLLSDKEYTYVSDTIKNSKKDTFMIKYIRDGKEYEVNLKKKNVLIDSVVSKEYENVGYIQIQTFSATTSKQVKDKINNFSKNIDSLIIDVRNNTGGYLSAAYEIADYFVAKGKPIYQLKNRENKITIYKAKNDILRNFKGISVLINNYSASASEILALALKESANATTIGVKSYGKGTVQETDTLSSGAMIKYTTSYWLSPNGNTINTTGQLLALINDLQEQINSCVQPTVDELFDKLLYTREEKELNNSKAVIREYEDRLDVAQHLQDTYNDLVSKLGLSDGVSFAEIQSVIQNNLVDIQGKISEKEKVEKGKEVIADEKAVVKEGEQKTI